MSKQSEQERTSAFYGLAEDGRKLPKDRIPRYNEMLRLRKLEESKEEAPEVKTLKDLTVSELKEIAKEHKVEVKGKKEVIVKTLEEAGVSLKEDGEVVIAKEAVESSTEATETTEESTESTETAKTEEVKEEETKEVEVKNNDEEFKAFIIAEKLESETVEKKIREYAQSKSIKKFDTKKLVVLTKELNITKEAAK